MKNIFQEASQKLNALKHTIHGNNQKTYSYECALQFNYCPLVWMCCNRSLNTKMNRLHKQCLQIVCNDKKTNFNELLAKDGSVSIHHQNLQKFAVEMIDFSRGLSPEIVNELFQFRESISYKLKRRSRFQIPFVHLVFGGTESLKFLAPKIWVLVPNETRQSESL